MATEQIFSPREVMQDWVRFSQSWVQFVNAQTGEDSGKGLVELTGVDIDGSKRAWSAASVEYREASGERHRYGPLPAGCRIRLAPKWKHKGYSMVTVPRSEYHAPKQTFTWVSMVPARQYRYGLSHRAFEVRDTHSVYYLGQECAPSFHEMAYLWKDGPQFVQPADVDLSTGAALTTTIGVHPMVEGIGAICWNAKRVIGFYHEGRLRVENSSRPLATPITHSGAIEYVSTKVLTDFYQSEILPRKVRPGEAHVPRRHRERHNLRIRDLPPPPPGGFGRAVAGDIDRIAVDAPPEMPRDVRWVADAGLARARRRR